MEGFEELLNQVSKEESNNKIPSNFNTGSSFEDRVLKKIGKRRKQIRVNIAVSIIFTIFGAFFGYFIINDINLTRNMSSVPIVANSKLNTNKKKKEEVWATDDIYFSTYDEKANYAIEQVSLTNNDEEI